MKIYFAISISNVALEFAAYITNIVKLFKFGGNTCSFWHCVMFDIWFFSYCCLSNKIFKFFMKFIQECAIIWKSKIHIFEYEGHISWVNAYTGDYCLATAFLKHLESEYQSWTPYLLSFRDIITMTHSFCLFFKYLRLWYL